MNLFIFVAEAKDGTLRTGLFEAPSGSDARDMLPTLLREAGVDYERFDFRGVTSKRFTMLSVDWRKMTSPRNPEPTLSSNNGG
jgi:hypothetical protein